MTHPTPEELATVTALMRQIREVNGLREKSPGIFTLNGSPFVQFQSQEGVLFAELIAGAHKRGAFERMAITTATEQRKFIEELKRRVDKYAED